MGLITTEEATDIQDAEYTEIPDEKPVKHIGFNTHAQQSDEKQEPTNQQEAQQEEPEQQQAPVNNNPDNFFS